jgi:hypothetical protein
VSDAADRLAAGVLLGAVTVAIAVYLVWLNVWGIRGKVTSTLFRLAIASGSAAVLAAMIVVTMIFAYLSRDRTAIPIVENIGMGLIIAAVVCFAISIVCLVSGTVLHALSSRRAR